MAVPTQETAAPLTLDVALTPAYVARDARAQSTYLVVDVIRATTTLCVLFERGCRRVLVAPGIAEARTYRERHGRDILLAGEVAGVAPDGFEFGNSPVEFARAVVADREVVFATTNGTRALRACAGGRAVYAAALRNASAVCAAALDSTAWMREESPLASNASERVAGQGGASEPAVPTGEPAIVIVCSGRGERPAFDDTLCAGYLIGELRRQADARNMPIRLREGARIALAAVEGVRGALGLRAALGDSDAGRAVAQIGLHGDLDMCAALDATDIVPQVVATSDEGMLPLESRSRS